MTAPDVGPYRGPAAEDLRREWVRQRREIAWREHPDRGGDAATMQVELDALDRHFRRREAVGPAADVELSAPSPWQPAARVVRRTARSWRRAGRAGRARIPPGWPGHRRYLDL